MLKKITVCLISIVNQLSIVYHSCMKSLKRLRDLFSVSNTIIAVNRLTQYYYDIIDRFFIGFYKNFMNCRVIFHDLSQNLRK